MMYATRNVVAFMILEEFCCLFHFVAMQDSILLVYKTKTHNETGTYDFKSFRGTIIGNGNKIHAACQRGIISAGEPDSNQ